MLGFLASFAQVPAPAFKIEAVYLVKIIGFVDWPGNAFSGSNSPVVVGVLGADPFGAALDEAADGELARGNRRIVVRRFHNLEDVKNVQVLFVGHSESERLASIFLSLKNQSVLTVSDIQNFCAKGGGVRLLVEKNKVRFRINVDAARRCNVQISSKLLQLAEIVHDWSP